MQTGAHNLLPNPNPIPSRSTDLPGNKPLRLVRGGKAPPGQARSEVGGDRAAYREYVGELPK